MLHLVNTVAAHVADDAQHAIGRARRNAVIYTLVAALVFSAFLAGLVALGIYLSPMFGPAMAAVLIALGALTVAVIILIAGQIITAKEKRNTNRHTELAASAAIALLPLIMRTNKPLLLAALGGAGFLAAQAIGKNDSET